VGGDGVKGVRQSEHAEHGNGNLQHDGLARSEEEAAYAEDVTGAGSLLAVPTRPQRNRTRRCCRVGDRILAHSERIAIGLRKRVCSRVTGGLVVVIGQRVTRRRAWQNERRYLRALLEKSVVVLFNRKPMNSTTLADRSKQRRSTMLLKQYLSKKRVQSTAARL
jgi:hypothetical protein